MNGTNATSTTSLSSAGKGPTDASFGAGSTEAETAIRARHGLSSQSRPTCRTSLIAHCIWRPLHFKRSKDFGVDDPRRLSLFRPHPGSVKIFTPEMPRIHAALFFAPRIGLHAMRDAGLTELVGKSPGPGKRSHAHTFKLILFREGRRWRRGLLCTGKDKAHATIRTLCRRESEFFLA